MPHRPFQLSVQTLISGESALLRELVASPLLSPDCPKAIIRLATETSAKLLPNLHAELKKIRRKERDAVLIHNLPRFENSSLLEKERLTKILSIFVSSVIGLPFQYLQQNHGQVAAKVAPEKGFEATHSSLGSSEFGWHSDDSFLPGPYRTKWITLTGFINKDHVLTKLSHVDSIAREIASDSFATLLQPRFALKIPVSFQIGDRTEINELSDVPLLWFDSSRNLNISAAIYNTAPTRAGDTEALRSLQALKNAAEQEAFTCDLQAGSMLIFNNDKFLHARNPIPGERVVFRTYIKSDLWALRRTSGETGGFVFDLHKVISKLKMKTTANGDLHV